MTDIIKQVSLSEVITRSNYRQNYDMDFVESTASDMAKNGFRHEFPLSVYRESDKYTVIDGNTRHKSAMLGSAYDIKTHLPIMLVWVAISDKPSDKDFTILQLRANDNRRSVDDISTAHAYQTAINSGATIDELARETTHTSEYIERRLALLSLLPEVQELVTKKQIGITFAYAMRNLDSNFQRLALSAYNHMKSPTFEEFSAVVDDFYTKQSQCSLFDLSLFNGQPIEQIMNELKIERKKSRTELEEELEAERKARQADRAFAIQKYQQLRAQLETLRQQLENTQKVA